MRTRSTKVEVDGDVVAITEPHAPLADALALTKADLVAYTLAVADGALRGVARRPLVLARVRDGALAQELVVVHTKADLLRLVELGSVELEPYAVRADDLVHPDELRLELAPLAGAPWSQLVEVADITRHVLADFGLVSFVKTSGEAGLHLLVRIAPRWEHAEVRRAALAVAREVERRAPALATTRHASILPHGVVVDVEHNAEDRTLASAYAVRPSADARVSTPVTWDELPTCDPASFTVHTVPARHARIGDPHEAIDDVLGELEGLLALADAQDRTGLAARSFRIAASPAPVVRRGQAGRREGPRTRATAARATRDANTGRSWTK